jgi:hypothetical protein
MQCYLIFGKTRLGMTSAPHHVFLIIPHTNGHQPDHDSSTREALGTLSDLYGATGGADSAVESHPGEYASKAQRNLRRDMENKLAESSHHFVKALGEVGLVRLVFVLQSYHILTP